MPLRIYNTISHEEEIFEPLKPNNVNMYVCGVTPYDDSHLGHGRAYVAFDVVRRYLEYLGYKVNYIQNITDIDDKIIDRANDRGISIQELTKEYSDNFFDVMKQLNVKPANMQDASNERAVCCLRACDRASGAFSLDRRRAR